MGTLPDVTVGMLGPSCLLLSFSSFKPCIGLLWGNRLKYSSRIEWKAGSQTPYSICNRVGQRVVRGCIYVAGCFNVRLFRLGQVSLSEAASQPICLDSVQVVVRANKP